MTATFSTLAITLGACSTPELHARKETRDQTPAPLTNAKDDFAWNGQAFTDYTAAYFILVIEKSNGDYEFCGGTALSPNTVITAAHCVDFVSGGIKTVWALDNLELRGRLNQAIDGKGAFRRFKDVLLNYPVERERWFTYRGDLLHWQIQQWMEREQIESTEAAPWGEVKAPEQPEVVLERPSTASGEGPGELLRRQAKELVDQVPAVELPAAIAFLEFLRERGIASLGRVRAVTVKRTAA